MDSVLQPDGKSYATELREKSNGATNQRFCFNERDTQFALISMVERAGGIREKERSTRRTSYESMR